MSAPNITNVVPRTCEQGNKDAGGQGHDLDIVVSGHNLDINCTAYFAGTALQGYYVLPPAWVNTTTYQTGDVVTRNGLRYVSLHDANTNHDPATSPTYWDQDGTAEIDATIPLALLNTIGTFSITVRNASNQTSNAVDFFVTYPKPIIDATSPPVFYVNDLRQVMCSSFGYTFRSGMILRILPPGDTTEIVVTPTLVGNGGAKFDLTAPMVDQAGSIRLRPQQADATLGPDKNVNINNPVAVLSSLSPSVKPWNSAQFTLAVYGTSFISGATVKWNTQNLATTFVSATQLNATVSATLLAGSGAAVTINISVYTAAPGGGTSNVLPFYLGNASAFPIITSLWPASATVGDPGFTLEVRDDNVTGSYTQFGNQVVRWAGSDRATTWASANKLTAQIPASDLVSPSLVPITVYTPPPGGGLSAPFSFTIASANPVPSISLLSPPSAKQNSAQFTLGITGNGFVASSVAQWNGANLAFDTTGHPTDYWTATQLYVIVPAANLTTLGQVTVGVVNPAPGGGTDTAIFTVVASTDNPIPHIDSISPSAEPQGYGSTVTLTVQGNSFVPGSQVRWNTTSLPTTYSTANAVTATLSSSYFTTDGAFAISVYSPGPGGGMSNTLPFAVNASANPIPTLSSVTPETVDRGTTPTLILTGNRFVASSVVLWDGATRTPVQPIPNSGQMSLVVLSSDTDNLTGVVARINTRAQSAAHTSAAQSVHALSGGDLQRPAITVGGEDTGLYRANDYDLGIAAVGADVGRFLGPNPVRGTAYRGGFATPEARRIPPWIEPEVSASGNTTINTTAATDIPGTLLTFTPGCDVRVEVKACFDVTCTTLGSTAFVGELFVGPSARPAPAVFAATATGQRATVFQVWNFVLPGAVAVSLKLAGHVGTVGGSYTVWATQTKWSMFAVGRY